MTTAYRVHKADLSLLLTLSLAIRLVLALLQQQPGYMDASYSYDIALNLARGQGFVEPFLWNYLDNPAGLPHPSHLYWMPLPSILAWMGLILFGQTYRAAQVPFAILSALLPLVSYWVAIQTTGSRRHGWLAGLLTLFSGFYVLYWGHVDNFTPFALSGSLSLVAVWQATRVWETGWRLKAGGWALAAGALVGLAHLSRADGPLLLIAIVITMVIYRPFGTRHPSSVIRHVVLIVLGYILVMLPWFVRNWMVVGVLLPAAGTQTIFLTNYDDLFSYGRELSLRTYMAWGWSHILRSKLDALWLNTQTVVAVFFMVFLLPLIPIGWWRLRRHQLHQLAMWYGVLLFLAMTFVFTFPGPRGGLLHSGGVLLPFVFTTALAGLDALVEWAAARRWGWDVNRAKRMFGVGLVGLALLVSGFLTYRGILAEISGQGDEAPYSHLVKWLASQGQAEAVVMVGDPPGYWYYSGGPSIVVPNGPVEMVLAVADRYDARYLVLDRNRPYPLSSLYEGRETHPRLRLVGSLSGDMRIYYIEPPQKLKDKCPCGSG